MAERALVKYVEEEWRRFTRKQKAKRSTSEGDMRTLMARRRRVQESFLFFITNVLQVKKPRSCWVEPGRAGSFFWERTVSSWNGPDFDHLWVQNFRLKKTTFLFICQQLDATLRKQNTRMRDAIPTEKRVALCIWHLATGEDMRSLAWRFDTGKSTACTIVNEVCQAIVSQLLPLYVKWPTGEDLQKSVAGFRSTWNFPQCVGAIDGTHIEILAPPECSSDYYNRKGRYSIIMQAVVDHACRFTDICIKWPGKVHDARVLVNSSLYEKAQSGNLFPNCTEEIAGVDVPLQILGDPAYPLLPWLMKRFPENGTLTAEQKHFNYRLSRARMVVEAAFGRLKGRFRCLLKRNDTTLEYLPTKVATCCVLHNLCELRNEEFDDELLANIQVDSPDQYVSLDMDNGTPASAIRNALVRYCSPS